MSDYFEIFGLGRKLQVDVAALEKAFYAKSRLLHPDRFPEKLEESSRLNDAYRTLKDPIARTEYLLKLEGVELEEQSRAATDAAKATGGEKKQVVPPELLEEAFELNMQLEEMRMAKKMGEDEPGLRADLEKAKANFEGMLSGLQEELHGLWVEWDASGSDAVKGKLVDLLNRRSYVRNLVRDVNEALE